MALQASNGVNDMLGLEDILHTFQRVYLEEIAETYHNANSYLRVHPRSNSIQIQCQTFMVFSIESEHLYQPSMHLTFE